MGNEIVMAKEGTIKYGKFIKYIGEIYKFQGEEYPNGQGTMYLFGLNGKSTETTISGNFNFVETDGKRKIENVNVQSQGEFDFSFSGTLLYSIVADKNQNVVLMAFDGDLSSYQLRVEGRNAEKISVKNLILEFNYEKGWQNWKLSCKDPQVIIETPNQLPIGLKFFGITLDQLLSTVCNMNFSEKAIKADEIKYVLKDNAFFVDDELIFKDGSNFSYNNGNWSGKKILSEGTIEKKENSNEFRINYNNGNVYIGTLKASEPHDIIYAKDLSGIKYEDGVLTSSGKPEKVIKGEMFSARHQRLAKVLDEELLAAVEDGSMSEADAKTKQAQLDRQREEAKKNANVEELLQEWFGNSNTVTFKAKAIGKPTKESLGGFRELGLKVGDIVYDCTLVLRKDNTGTVTYRLSPSEQTTADQTIHYKKNGAKIRHGAYVAEFCNTINGSAEPESGEWSIDGGVLKFKKWDFEISEDHKKITWEFLEYITLELTGNSTTNLQPQKVAPYPKTLVGKQYEGVVHMGNLDPSLIKIHMSVKFLDSRQMKMHASFKPMNDDGMKMLLEMFEPGVTEQDTIFHYTYQNGVVKIKDSTDKYTLRKNNTELYWYVNDDYNGSLYLKK